MTRKFYASLSQLYWRTRQIKKILFYSSRAGNKLEKNQKQIIETLKKKGMVDLKPIPAYGGDGDTNNYFHFIYDLIFPLYLILSKVPHAKIGLDFEELGNLRSDLFDLFPEQVFDCGNNCKDQIDMYGMNPLLVSITTFEFHSFKNFIVERLQVDLSAKANKIILIERAENMNNPLNQAGNPRTGSAKRHMKNHRSVQKYLEKQAKGKFEVLNVQLENRSLQEQVKLFDQAILVVAQHGAGLANMAWMRSGSYVIELRSDLLRLHYKRLANFLSLNYFLYFQIGNHVHVSIKRLNNLLNRKEGLRRLMYA